MLDIATSRGEAANPRQAAASLRAPLVSVVVSNYNYGRFLRSAVESVRAQTYHPIECIVVDDCSSDCSDAVLAALKDEDTSLDVVRLGRNSGQSLALLEGLARAKGEFLLFLDADDFLFPNCVSSHVALHLSSRRVVGFSCCNALQLVGDDHIQGRWSTLSAAFLQLPADPLLLSANVGDSLKQFGIELPQIDPQKVRAITWQNTRWPWTSTSSMFFRRDALELICAAPGLRDLRIATDNYLAHAVNHLTGSLILDETLVGYRIHGTNNFNKRPALENFRCHNRVDEHYHLTQRIMIDDLVSRFSHYAAHMDDPRRIFEICRILDHRDREVGLPRWAARSRFHRLVVEHRQSWRPFFTRKQMLELILSRRLPNPWPARFLAI